MKVIALMPVKNEVDILPSTLSVLSQFCDHIIVADQASNDGSRELYKEFPKIEMIDNLEDGHSNKVRWQLLNKAREYGNSNFIISVDADEFLPPKLFKSFLNNLDKFKPGTFFYFPWIQLWKGVDKYNNSGVWKNNFKAIAFWDDGRVRYNNDFVINDHCSRVPIGNNKSVLIKDIPLVHLQWVYWDRTQIKQAWYRCVELVDGKLTAFEINEKYRISLLGSVSKNDLLTTPLEWLDDIELPKNIKEFKSGWQLNDIYKWFDQFGVEFFESLQVWHVEELKDEFIKRVGREPGAEKVSKYFLIKEFLSKFYLVKITWRLVKILVSLIQGVFQNNLESYKQHDSEYKLNNSLKDHIGTYKEYDDIDLFNSSEFKLDKLLNKNPLVRDMVVDVGSGAGWLSAQLSKSFSKVIAIEPSADAINIAKKLYPENDYPNIDWLVGLAEDELKKIKIDKPILFVTGCVFSHLTNRVVKKSLKEINLIAQKDSIICFSECWGKTYHRKMWHVRTKKWWQKYLPDWEIDFHGASIQNKKNRYKGFHAVKIK